MRELFLVGLLCLLFGFGSYRGAGELGVFGTANLIVAAIALVGAAVTFARQWSARRQGTPSGPLLESALLCVAVVWAVVLVQQATSVSGVRFDLTFEGRYDLSPATEQALARLPMRVYATLYNDPNDPRRRRTRLLLDQLTVHGDMVVRERNLGAAPEEEDLFGIASSNTVVFEMGERWERVDRPTEGALFEAISYLAVTDPKILYVTSGAGEGNVADTGDVGFSGLAAALETEGIQLRQIAAAAIPEIPGDADGVLMISPERNLHAATLDALRRYLAGGGSLVALLQPGAHSGVEDVLAEFGLTSPDAVVVDPASGNVDGSDSGIDPIAFNYASDNAVTRGLDSNRRTYFKGARSFSLRKQQPQDVLRAVVFASRESWLYDGPKIGEGAKVPPRPPNARQDYHPLVVTGKYERGDAVARIVALGDSDFANNANLRSLYNLDLVMNAVHWALRDEPRISLRPKAGQLIQFPVPIQNSLRAFYGVGLLVPELLLLAGGLVWLRRRSA